MKGLDVELCSQTMEVIVYSEPQGIGEVPRKMWRKHCQKQEEDQERGSRKGNDLPDKLQEREFVKKEEPEDVRVDSVSTAEKKLKAADLWWTEQWLFEWAVICSFKNTLKWLLRCSSNLRTQMSDLTHSFWSQLNLEHKASVIHPRQTYKLTTQAPDPTDSFVGPTWK